MLQSIKISNFYSIGKEIELKFGISPKDVLDDSARFISDSAAINVTNCIVGANASGKTSILKAMTFIFWLIERSYTSLKADALIPMEPHKLLADQSSSIEIVFLNNKKLYKYSIEFNQREIIKESLSRKIDRMTSVYTLSRTKNRVTITPRGFKINEQDAKRFKSRKNVPLLSSLIDTGYFPDLTFFKHGDSNVNQLGIVTHSASKTLEASEMLYKDVKLRNEVLSHIRNSDFGISDFKFKEVVFKSTDSPESEETLQVVQVVHSSDRASFELEILDESNGTQHSFAILCLIFPVLRTGGIVILDEIEAGIHPYVVKKIVSLFEKKSSNPKNAQLFFTTHQHLLLKERTKSQIFIAERSEDFFQTDIFRLDEMEGIRNDENYFNKYIAGAYGGTPKVDWL